MPAFEVELSVKEDSTTEQARVSSQELKGGSGSKVGVAAAVACGITLFPGIAATAGAMSGAIGASILKAASTNIYDPQQAAAAGAAGSAVLAIPVTIFLACFACITGGNTDAKDNRKCTAGTTLLTTGLVAMSGALGYAMRYSGNSDEEMNAGQFTASTALGTGALVTAAAAATAVLLRRYL